jgi:hypothetical protein
MQLAGGGHALDPQIDQSTDQPINQPDTVTGRGGRAAVTVQASSGAEVRRVMRTGRKTRRGWRRRRWQ